MRPLIFRGITAFLCGIALEVCTLHASIDQPVITSIQSDQSNVVVRVDVPAGIQKVTLESRERVGSGTWEPRAVARLNRAGGQVAFHLAQEKSLELLRVRADENDPLPNAFYAGPSSFNGSLGSSPYGPSVYYTLDGATPGATPPTEGNSAPREVKESDIWMMHGARLYFFNQLRGLQIIDLTNPDAPVLLGTLSLPAVGEKMYLAGDHHVVLLAHNGCSADSSEVMIVEDRAGTPVAVRSLPVLGFIQESRMVGTALYVASQSYRSVAGSPNPTWEWGTQVSSFDLSDPVNPVARDSLFFSGYGNVISATDVLLFVVTQDPSNWWQSVVRIVDITAPDGSMRAYESLKMAGRIADKFKLNYVGQIFTSISEDRNGNGTGRLVTRLETFRVPDPRSAGPLGVVKLGELELGAGEQLHATRFDGDRVYVVTFFRIDPLWVVSLSEPTRPRIVGHVEIPGWSTYIEPLGDRLVAIGVETNRVAVSLFDVGDPIHPHLADKVLLGDMYSYSEANWDEKAFNVFADQGLILVPYTGYATTGYATRVQLIDLGQQDLTARGVIERSMQPRRATLYGERILSLSGWELLSVDAADRDAPVVRGSVELAWPVDRVLLHGQHLLQIADSAGWHQGDFPSVRISLAESPESILEEVSLGDLPVIGASVRGDYLYVAQGTAGGWYPILLADGTSDPNVGQPIVLSVFDLRVLPQLPLTGRVEAQTKGTFNSSRAQMLWPQEGVLVLAGTQSSWWWWNNPIGVFPGGGVSIGLLPFWGGQNGQLLAFDVQDPVAPKLSSEVELTGDAGWWNFSTAFAANGLIYLSHQAGEFVGPVGVPGVPPLGTGIDQSQLRYPDGAWVWRHFLNVVDFTDPENPMVRKPVNIPGMLAGISRGGALLYTLGQRWDENGQTDGRDTLSVSAYDGVAAHLIDALPLPYEWPHPVHIIDENIFIGLPALAVADPNTPPKIESWTLAGTGKLVQLGAVDLREAAQSLAHFDGLLAAQLSQPSNQSVTLIDPINPSALRVLGSGGVSGCIWFDLTFADGTAGDGLWIPLGVYGVGKVGVE